MWTPTTESLLAAWDSGRRQSSAARGITLLQIGFPESPRASLAEITVGERDRRLLALRQAVFGASAPALTACPYCGERLELDLPLAEFQLSSADCPQTEVLDREGYRIRFRLPRSRDLLGLARDGDMASAARLLFERCVESVERDGDLIEREAIPDALASAIASRLEEMDPQGDIGFELACPACSTRWRAVFDIVSFLWTELDAWAGRLLRQVHTLASAYGWRESEILAMSASRRDFYLDLVSG